MVQLARNLYREEIHLCKNLKTRAKFFWTLLLPTSGRFFLFVSSHARVSAARRLSVSSDASRHRIIRAPMRQIREGVLIASQRSAERSDMGGVVRVCVEEGRVVVVRGRGWGRGRGSFKDGSTTPAICSEKKNIQSNSCWRKTERHQRSASGGTTLARGRGHKCYHAAPGDMPALSSSSLSYHCLLCLGRIKAGQRTDLLLLQEQF